MMKTIPLKYVIAWVAGFSALSAGSTSFGSFHRFFFILTGLYITGGCYFVLRFVAPVKPWLKILLYFLALLGAMMILAALV